MPLIEQAVFTSDETRFTTDYRVVSRSVGVHDVDARELAAWCPTHDALSEPDAESFNFHPLPSGAFCVSRTTMADRSGVRPGPQRSQTHCLIVPPGLLLQFANNPLALIRVAMDHGAFKDAVPASSRLEPLSLGGDAAMIDRSLLAELAKVPGPGNIAALIAVARNSVSVALAGHPSPGKLIEGLLNCLPPSCRIEYSFSTGLKFSPRRPFRLVVLSDDPAEKLWVANHPNVSVFEATCSNTSPRDVMLDEWACLIERILASDQIDFFSTRLSKRGLEVTPDDLPVLGLQLLEELDAGTTCDDDGPSDDAEPDERTAPRAHTAHRRFEKSLREVVSVDTQPASPLAAAVPNTSQQLDSLDDLVRGAICGRICAMQRLRAAWPKIMAELGDDLAAKSREHYIRYALSIWESGNDASEVRDSARAVHALDVLSLLFGDV